MAMPQPQFIPGQLSIPYFNSLEDFLRWAAVERGLKPDQVFYIFFTHHQFQRNESPIVHLIGGMTNAIRLFMNNGGRTLFSFLNTPEGLAWLRKDDNLERFFRYMTEFR